MNDLELIFSMLGEAAHQAHQMAASGDLESLKKTAKKIGSDFRPAAKSLHTTAPFAFSI